MEQFVDPETFDTTGFKYSEAEAQTARFAFKLYQDQLVEGRIIENAAEHPDYLDLLMLIDEQIQYIDDGLTTFNPNAHTALTTIFLPYLARMHANLPSHLYNGVCKDLGVSPEDLRTYGEAAAMMLDDSNAQIVIQ